MNKWSAFIIGVSLIMLVAPPGDAGECELSRASYLDCLEGVLQTGECPNPQRALMCAGTFYPQYARWGFAGAAEDLQEIKALPERERLIAAAEKYLDDPSTRKTAATVLAFQGGGEVGDYDIFELIAKQRFVDWYALAALGDPRTAELARERYKAFRSGEFDRKARYQALSIIDCLYHLRTSDSRVVLRQIAEQETDEAMVDYIHQTVGIKPSDPALDR